ncbi:MAG: DUF805 domain-containing protein [Prevotella sp.]
MKNVTSKPMLSFSEALKLSCSRLTQLNGRSRRSEFWWFMLVFIIAKFIVEMFLQTSVSTLTVQIIDLLLWGVAFAVTVRRLQDSGKSMWWVIASWATSAIYSVNLQLSGVYDKTGAAVGDPSVIMEFLKDPVTMTSYILSVITGILVFIFCLLDSNVEANKYGESPKYMTSCEEEE